MSKPLHDTLKRVTDRIMDRSRDSRAAYLAKVEAAKAKGPGRAHLTCGNLAHAFAASPEVDKPDLASARVPNVGIVTAYNDMLSAHQPYEHYPQLIRETARSFGGTAQVAGGVPAMCDGVTQGQDGMDISLFSRDLIAMATGVALSHDVFDSAVFLGVCDKIVPGLVIGAATFGHLPAVFLPAGPMPSGQGNEEKTKVRQDYAKGLVGREALLASEMASYHSAGTCTFYGTANSNQMLMEFMGLHMPGTSFINPGTELRDAVTRAAVRQALSITAKGNDFRPVADILDAKAFVNGMVGLNATGGSTNLLIHLVAMAKAAGLIVTLEDFEDISEVTPLLARAYPNGLADVNMFHAAGGLGVVVAELLSEGMLHEDAKSVVGDSMEAYTTEPRLDANGEAEWVKGAAGSLDDKIVRAISNPFQSQGGLKKLTGSLGTAVMKVSAVAPERHVIEAPVRIFQDQDAVKQAFKQNEFTSDTIVVVRFQGPKANGMPELHSLTPVLGILQERGLKVALVTDGRMSGASGKVPAAIHVCPEALDGGPIAKLRDGDIVRVDAKTGVLDIVDPAVLERGPVTADLSGQQIGMGRELFATFRASVSSVETGATQF
ncbi:6-phosphogluconate dehydratase [Cohaesibacter marisflavi]|uniref:Phosphogluconate dehydratase n=1 Tax=Cohaesibacter marisflavi TaxID=655353 RepID=A0A1I5LP96_9HYPH|nr:phosphogluconate dehydratase [Cohaesibacter marisflavi]SFO98646.1 6-phosphogluconate dehydratase [Cohaesibacter marisflavi]